jgi:hypothetical protein
MTPELSTWETKYHWAGLKEKCEALAEVVLMAIAANSPKKQRPEMQIFLREITEWEIYTILRRRKLFGR